MCGIAALLCQRPQRYSREVYAMTRSLLHRGPDDSGYAIATPQELILAGDEYSQSNTFRHISTYENQLGTAFFGHRRLAILDKSAQNRQPFIDKSGSYCLVFNGEIYNFRELRNILIRKGVQFFTQGDTEVVLQWLIHHGASGLQNLNGMFALVFWDNRTHKALLARDIVGMKPLYFTYNQDFVGISSEYRAFFSSNFWSIQPNELAVAEYLWRGKTNLSFYHEIEEVPVGSFIEFSNGKLSSARRYVVISAETIFEVPTPEKTQQFAENIREKIKFACNSHQIADVPVGLALSGGIDSSCLWSACEQKPATCFTVSWPHWDKDESRFAKLITQNHPGCQHIFVTPTEEQFQQDLSEFIQAQEVPVGSLSVYAQFCLMRAAQKVQIPVILDGQGGDELFGGYTRFFVMWLKEYLDNDFAGFLKEATRSNRRVNWILEWFYGFWGRYKPYISFLHPLSRWILLPYPKHTHVHFSCLNEVLLDSLQVSSLPILLRYADRNAMWFSIESRSPFADDQPLIAQIFQIPGMYKIQRFEAKTLLKSAFSDDLPTQVLHRTDKIGFEAPIHQWMFNLSLPNSEYFYSSNWLNINDLKKYWTKIKHQIPATLLWRILNILYWEKYFLDRHR